MKASALRATKARPPKGSPYERGRFATLPGEAIRCGGLWADRVVRPYKGFYKIHPHAYAAWPLQIDLPYRTE